MSTAELERLTEVRDALEDIRENLDFIAGMVGVVVATALFWLTLKAGWWKGLGDV
jgi:hypothetical protein